MKKSLLAAIPATAALLMTACSSDDNPTPLPTGDHNVSLKISLPDEPASRTYADGMSAKMLNYAVYLSDAPDKPLEVCPGADGAYSTSGVTYFPAGSLSTTLTLNLVPGKSYRVVFWAMNENAPYTFSAEDCNVTIDTDNLTVNDDNLDAFSSYINFTVDKNAVSKDVTLTRPFAQLNIGTDDLRIAQAQNMDVRSVAVKVPTFTTYNLAAGTVENSVDIMYRPAALPSGETYPVKGYEYLSMNYILASPEKETVSVDLYLNPENGTSTPFTSFDNIPIQRNYRTNLFGSLITVPSQFNIIISSDFAGEISSWDGRPHITLDNNEILISQRQIMQGLTVEGQGTLTLDNTTVSGVATTEPGITLAEGADVKINVVGNVKVTGGRGCDGVKVNSSASLELVGNTFTATGNAGYEYMAGQTDYSNTTDATYAGTGGCGIGNSGGTPGKISIHDLKNLSAMGYGKAGFGIGGTAADINIANTTISAVRGGYAQPLMIIDSKYGKSEPEGAPAIGTMGTIPGKIVMTNVNIQSARGGSKSAAIGGRYWSSSEILITGCTLRDVVGGNASAAIGGSRQPDTGDVATASIRIVDSDIECQGGQYGAGIGSGYDTHCRTVSPQAAYIVIEGTSSVKAVGGQYAAGIGTGYHVGGLSGYIASGVTTTGTVSGEKIYKAGYTEAQNIGYGVIDPAREGKDLDITFTVGGVKIAHPTVAAANP